MLRHLGVFSTLNLSGIEAGFIFLLGLCSAGIIVIKHMAVN